MIADRTNSPKNVIGTSALGLVVLSILSMCLSGFGAAHGESKVVPSSAQGLSGRTVLAFQGRRGIGAGLFGSPRRNSADPKLYDPDPYTPRWSRLIRPSRLSELKSAGFDFLRVPIEPGPFFEATDDLIFRERLSDIKEAVDLTLAAGLGIVLDMHFSENHPLWSFRQVTSGYETVAFKRYVITARALAGLIASYDRRQVAFEVFNEPPPPCDWHDRPPWPSQLARIYGEVRAAAPHHTLLLSGSCWASIEGLQRLDPAAFDNNTMFVFHDYAPRVFTQQGFWGSAKYLEYLPRLPYPPDPEQLPEQLSKIAERIRVATDIPSDQRNRELQEMTKYVSEYFSRWKGVENVEQEFNVVKNWTDQHAVSSNRIILGEFGTTRDVWGKQGPNRADRARWLADMRVTAEKYGYAWSVWSLTNTAGIVTGAVDGPLDPVILKALGMNAPYN